MFPRIHLTTIIFLGTLLLGLGISPVLSSVTREEKTITTDEYLSYLNSIAPSDTDHLYELKMGEGINQILRLGIPGDYFYLTPLENKESSLPFISLVSSECYCDWKNREVSSFSNNVTTPEAPIFHTNRDEEAAKADGAPPAVGRPRGKLPLGSPERARQAGASESTQTRILTQGCMNAYSPSQNGSLTQHPSDLPATAADRHEISGLDPLSEREENSLVDSTKALLLYSRSTNHDPLLSSNIIINVISSLKESLTAPQNEETSWEPLKIGGIFLVLLTSAWIVNRYSRPLSPTIDDSIPADVHSRIHFANEDNIICSPPHSLRGKDKITVLKNQLDASDSEDEEILHVFKNQLFSRKMYLDREDIDDQDLFNESSANIKILENLRSSEIHHKFFKGVVDSRTIQEIKDLIASHQKIIEWTQSNSIDDLSIEQQTNNLKKLTDSIKKLLDTKMGIQVDSIKAVAASCVSDVMGHAVQKTTREIFHQRYYDLLLQKHDHALTNFNHWQKLCYFCHEHQILPIEKLHQLVERANANSALCDKIVKNLKDLSLSHEELKEQDRFLAQETDEIDDLWKKASLAHSIKLVASSYASDALDRAVKTVKRESFNHSYWDPLEERYDKAHSNYGFFKKLYILLKEHQILPTQELHSLGESANANSARCAQIVRNLEEFSFNQRELQEHDHFLAQQNEKISEIIDKTKKKTVSSKIMNELEKITKTLSGWKPLSKFSPIKNYLEHRLMSSDSERTSLETSIDDNSDISN